MYATLTILLALAVQGAGAPAATGPAAPAPAWRALAPGVEHLQLVEGDAEAFRFDLERFRIGVLVPGAARPLTAAAFRAESGAMLAVNGGFFDTDWRPLGLRVASGRVLKGLRPRVDWGVLLVRDRRATVVHSRDYVPDAGVTEAIQVGPRLLVGGRPTQLKPQVARRTAVAVDREGRSLAVVVTRTRVSAAVLAEALARLGFDSALMLDGGPSTQLSAAVGPLSVEIPGGYPVPDALVVRPR